MIPDLIPLEQSRHYDLKEFINFFEPISSFADFRRQIRTPMFYPIIAFSYFHKAFNNTLKNLLMIGAGILSLSPSLFLEGVKNTGKSFLASIGGPLFVCGFAVAVLVSTVTNILVTPFNANKTSAFEDVREDLDLLVAIVEAQEGIPPKPQETSTVYQRGYQFFEQSIKEYGLQTMQPWVPFESLDDVQIHIKTILILPIIATWSLLNSVSKILEDLLVMGVAIPSLSPALFFTGLNDAVTHCMEGFMHPLLLCCIEFVFLLSTLTRVGLNILCSGDSNLMKELYEPERTYALYYQARLEEKNAM